MRSISRFVYIGLVVLLAACGGQPTTSGAPPPAQPAAPTQPPEATAAPQPTQPPQVEATKATPDAAPQPNNNMSNVLVVFHRSGGIAGIDETLTVYTDGRIEFSDRKDKKAAQVAPAELATLQQLLASPDFAALDQRYQAAGADLFIYEVTVPDGKRPHKVVTMDGAQNPPALKQVLEELSKLRKQV